MFGILALREEPKIFRVRKEGLLEIEEWQRVGAQKGGFETALFNLKSP